MVNPVVSISCITFNHGPYIKECIEGFLMQETSFDFEILIHDDASTDNTINVIKSYTEKYPDLIKPIFQKENQYSKGQRGMNIKFNFPRAKGKYIALCEGDDYWTDPLKLQKQVDFLEKNQNYMACFTNAYVINERFEKRNYISTTANYSYSTKEIIENGAGLFPTASLVFKNIQEYPEFMLNFKSGDRALSLLLATKGNFYLLNEKTCVYNSHGSGVFSAIKKDKEARININRDNINLLHAFNGYSNFKYNEIIKDTISTIALKSLLRNRYALLQYNRLFFYKHLKYRDWKQFANKVFYIKTKLL